MGSRTAAPLAGAGHGFSRLNSTLAMEARASALAATIVGRRRTLSAHYTCGIQVQRCVFGDKPNAAGINHTHDTIQYVCM